MPNNAHSKKYDFQCKSAGFLCIELWTGSHVNNKMAGQAAVKFVTKAIQKDPVVVFSKTTCSFSLMAKKILKQVGVSQMTVYEIERRQDGDHIQVSSLCFVTHYIT